MKWKRETNIKKRSRLNWTQHKTRRLTLWIGRLTENNSQTLYRMAMKLRKCAKQECNWVLINVVLHTILLFDWRLFLPPFLAESPILPIPVGDCAELRLCWLVCIWNSCRAVWTNLELKILQKAQHKWRSESGTMLVATSASATCVCVQEWKGCLADLYSPVDSAWEELSFSFWKSQLTRLFWGCSFCLNIFFCSHQNRKKENWLETKKQRNNGKWKKKKQKWQISMYFLLPSSATAWKFNKRRDGFD